MRVKGLIFIVVLAAIGFAATFFITDEFVEEKLEYQLSVANGALVEIDELDFDPTQLHMSWKRLQVTNPDNTMQNTFETGPTEFDVEFWPILWQKVMVNNVQMTGFALQTERATDGYFEMPVEEEEPEDKEPGFLSEVTGEVTSEISKNANMQFNDIKDDINTDSLLALVDLKSIDKMDSLKSDVQGTYSEWENKINNNSIEQNANDIKTLVNSIKLDEIKDVPKVVAAIETIKKVQKEADSLKKEVNDFRTNFQSDLTNARTGLGSIDGWVRDDINSAAQIAKLPDINAQNIGTALFGESLLADLNKYLGYIATGRKYGSRLKGDKEEEEEIERYEGRNFEFTDKYDLPAVWIKKIELSGVTNNAINLSGLVTNVSNDQTKTGQPIVFDLGGEDENGVSLTMDGTLDYMSDEKHESMEIAYSGFTLAKSKLSPSELLPYELSKGKGELAVSLDVIDKRIDSQVRYLAEDIGFDFASAGSPKNAVERVIRNAISGTDEINATALISNTDGPLKVKVRSNVDDLFLNSLRSTIQAEVDKAKQQIRNEVEGRVDAKRKEVESLVADKEKELRGYYSELETRINKELEIVDKKKEELEAKKKELEDSLKDKAADALRKKIGF